MKPSNTQDTTKLLSDLIPREQFRIEAWQNKFNAGGQHTNGPCPYLYVEHEPTGVCVILPYRNYRGGHQAVEVGIDAIVSIITDPRSNRVFESYSRQASESKDHD